LTTVSVKNGYSREVNESQESTKNGIVSKNHFC
jgi:hypothetical protein